MTSSSVNFIRIAWHLFVVFSSRSSGAAVQRHLLHQQQLQAQAQARRRQTINGYTQIPDDLSGRAGVPYKVSRMQVQNVPVYCINMTAFSNTDQLMSLQDLNDNFIRNIGVDTIKSMLIALQVELYIGNRWVMSLRQYAVDLRTYSKIVFLPLSLSHIPQATISSI